MEMSIRFPGLGLVFNYVPRSFQIFGMEFTIYGVLIAVGALLGMGLVTLEAKRNGEDQNRYLDMMLISLLVSVAGSRLFYVAFSWGFYKENLNAILDFRNGGYALYGGLLFGFLAAAVFCRITQTSFWQSADIAPISSRGLSLLPESFLWVLLRALPASFGIASSATAWLITVVRR